jgi:hypothetical protein
MRSKIKINELNVINNQRIASRSTSDESNSNSSGNKQVLEIISSEGSDDLVSYVEWLGLPGYKNTLVLSSKHHYYYDVEEIKNVKCVINLKELNQIHNLKNFLHSIFRVLPPRSYFVGCFIDNNKNNGFELKESSSTTVNETNSDAVDNGITSRIPFLNMLYSFMDLKTNNYLSGESINSLIRVHGFKVVDMTELNGITYFCAQNLRTADS